MKGVFLLFNFVPCSLSSLARYLIVILSLSLITGKYWRRKICPTTTEGEGGGVARRRRKAKGRNGTKEQSAPPRPPPLLFSLLVQRLSVLAQMNTLDTSSFKYMLHWRKAGNKLFVHWPIDGSAGKGFGGFIMFCLSPMFSLWPLVKGVFGSSLRRRNPAVGVSKI